jgi:branched-chain amino acid transport system permease protein
MTTLMQQLINGLAAGSVYALIAVGYNLVFGLLGLINFAHGDVFMIGTYAVLSLLLIGAPFPLAVLFGLAIGALLGLLIERIAYRPLRNADRLAPTISAVGVALVLENIALRIWGPSTRPFPSPVPNAVINIGGVVVTELQIIILGTALTISMVLYGLVQFTSWGRMVRAIRDDLPTAELMGIPVNTIIPSVYALGSVLGVVAGILFASYYNSVYVTMGFTGTLNAFTAAVIGGIGSTKGSFAGGLLLGVTQALGAGYIASGYENSITFVVLIILLVLRPNGLFGRALLNRS